MSRRHSEAPSANPEPVLVSEPVKHPIPDHCFSSEVTRMPFFTVLMTHPDGPGWGEHVRAHVDYLRDLVAKGPLKASGPVKDSPTRAGFLIFQADSRQAVEAMVRDDPFAVHGLIETLTIHEWDPLFGDYADESSGSLPGLGTTR